MGDVISAGIVTKLAIDPKKVTSAADATEFKRVIIIGVTTDGEWYFASSEGDAGTHLYDMEVFRTTLMKLAEDRG